jgi:hypothetical protein
MICSVFSTQVLLFKNLYDLPGLFFYKNHNFIDFNFFIGNLSSGQFGSIWVISYEFGSIRVISPLGFGSIWVNLGHFIWIWPLLGHFSIGIFNFSIGNLKKTSKKLKKWLLGSKTIKTGKKPKQIPAWNRTCEPWPTKFWLFQKPIWFAVSFFFLYDLPYLFPV